MAEKFLDPEQIKRELEQYESELNKRRKEREEAARKDRLQQELEKHRLENERLKQEQLEDARREGREQEKLLRELEQGEKPKHDPLLQSVKSPEQIERERQQVQEFLQSKKPVEEPKVERELPTEKPQTYKTIKPSKKNFAPEEAPKVDPKKLKIIDPYLKKLDKRIEMLFKQRNKAVKEDKVDKVVELETQGHDLEKQKRLLKMWASDQIGADQLPKELLNEITDTSLTTAEKELLANPEYFQQTDPKELKCMNHPDRPAAMILKHHGVLEENAPPVPLCDQCGLKLKMVPIMENNPSPALLKRLSQLADKLDRKGLYKEADIIDNIIRKAVELSPEEYEKYYGNQAFTWKNRQLDLSDPKDYEKYFGHPMKQEGPKEPEAPVAKAPNMPEQAYSDMRLKQELQKLKDIIQFVHKPSVSVVQTEALKISGHTKVHMTNDMFPSYNMSKYGYLEKYISDNILIILDLRGDFIEFYVITPKNVESEKFYAEIFKDVQEVF